MKRVLAILMTASVVLAGCFGNAESDVFYGEDINPPMPVDDFVLMDENGEYY